MHLEPKQTNEIETTFDRRLEVYMIAECTIGDMSMHYRRHVKRTKRQPIRVNNSGCRSIHFAPYISQAAFEPGGCDTNYVT
jgi:hypothetical protein